MGATGDPAASVALKSTRRPFADARQFRSTGPLKSDGGEGFGDWNSIHIVLSHHFFY